MVGIGDEPGFCGGCGREVATCTAAPCGRSGEEATPRFCRRCGWRLREIAVVPGVGRLWCRTHGVVDDE